MCSPSIFPQLSLLRNIDRLRMQYAYVIALKISLYLCKKIGKINKTKFSLLVANEKQRFLKNFKIKTSCL